MTNMSPRDRMLCTIESLSPKWSLGHEVSQVKMNKEKQSKVIQKSAQGTEGSEQIQMCYPDSPIPVESEQLLGALERCKAILR